MRPLATSNRLCSEEQANNPNEANATVANSDFNARSSPAGQLLSRVNQGGKRDNQDGKFFEGTFFEPFGSDLTP
jgi:hypothetical protein